MANFGLVGLDWQQRVNWDRMRTYRLERARERMKAAGLSALILMYDENVRYVTSTLTPGWNRLKPGLRYAMLCGDDPPVLFEQGDIGMQIKRHSPWIPPKKTFAIPTPGSKVQRARHHLSRSANSSRPSRGDEEDATSPAKRSASTSSIST